jgi:hypothetical protein
MNFGEWIEEKIVTEKNIERFVKYYWLVSTFRLALGVTIMLLILLAGYEFEDLLPK